jgi:subfamily B ATP-binding cassette protein MsbA
MKIPFAPPISKSDRSLQGNVIIQELKRYPVLVSLALIFTFLSVIFEGIGVGFILTFLQSLTDPDAAPVRSGIEWFDSWILGVNESITERVYRTSALIFLSTWLRGLFMYLSRVYSWRTQMNLLDSLRKRLFEQFQRLSLAYYSKTRTGDLVHNISSELEKLQPAFDTVAYLIARASTLAAYIVSMFWLSWQLSIVSLILFGFLTIGLSGLIRRVREISFEISQAGADFLSIAVEFISGIRTVNAFATNEFERRRFYAASEHFANKVNKSAALRELVEPLGEAAATSILIGMIVVAFSMLIPSGQLRIPELLTFLFVLFRMVPLVRQVNGARAQLSYYEAPITIIQNLLRTDDKPYLTTGSARFVGLKRAIEFISVDFGYSPASLVLHNITMTIQQGQTVALVGASGAGKTTLVDLIPRFYDPTQGSILVDGVDLRTFDIISLRRKMAIVSQDTFIFNTSVRDNIAYGSETATEAEIHEAARIANALEFILEMPDGFETRLGDRGVRLSGGQRQRLAIARAVLRDPEILILDEATSALDSVSERLIQEALEKLSVNRTVIAIAHRLSTIRQADKVIVMEQGQIVEQGTYQELLDRRGKLWNYHQMQYEAVHSPSTHQFESEYRPS